MSQSNVTDLTARRPDRFAVVSPFFGMAYGDLNPFKKCLAFPASEIWAKPHEPAVASRSPVEPIKIPVVWV